MESQYEIAAQKIRSYLDENQLGNFEKEEFESCFKSFQEKFAPEILKQLDGEDLLNSIFLHDGDRTTLCYNLEFEKEYSRTGSIKGGSAAKFSLFKRNKDGNWVTGVGRSVHPISIDEAIEIGTKIRDALVNGANHIENFRLETIEDYNDLEKDLENIFKDSPAKPIHSWIHKYYVLIFPDKFPIVHNAQMRKDTLLKYDIEPLDGYYLNDGQLVELCKKAGMKLYSIFDENIVRLFYKKGESIWEEYEEDSNESTDYKPYESIIKRNIIYFGAPGTGKSYNLNEDMQKLNADYERVTFHPDYSYANFIGTYKPVPKGESISYEYVPGPFMRSLVKSLKNPSEPFLLIIEEINRANVAAVFGDVFQLLDRDSNNESRYPIETTEDMRGYLKKELNQGFDKIKIPSNMFIWATMNSADQGVFPMDTAFKRRWDFKYFGINQNENLVSNIIVELNGRLISWNELRKAINEELLTYKINEDKLLGPFFFFFEYLDSEIPLDEFMETFKSKIIMYLFEDAARSKRNDLFSGVSKNTNLTYSEICEAFDKNGVEIFCDNIKEKFIYEDE